MEGHGCQEDDLVQQVRKGVFELLYVSGYVPGTANAGDIAIHMTSVRGGFLAAIRKIICSCLTYKQTDMPNA